nr:hypothetical protein [Tanacetum cinerariifolium]
MDLHLISHLLLHQRDHPDLQELLELPDHPKCHHHLHLYPPVKKVHLEIDEDMALDEQAQLSDVEDIGSAHILTVNLRQGWWKPFEEERPATLEPAWSIRSSDVLVPTNNWASALAFGLMRSANKILLQCMVSLTGGSKDNDSTLIDTHLKVIAAQSGHICGSSVLYKSKSFSMYGYDYIKKTVLRHADLNKHVIAERDFKYLYPSDFEDLYLLNLQGFEYKHDYTVIDSPRAVIFRDKYGVQVMMRFNEIHKFSDVCSSLRSLKSKRTIESRAKGSSKRISLGHYPIMLASSHTVKSKTNIKSPTHYPC